MARMSSSQTWSVGPVAITITAIGDPVPRGWPDLIAPVVLAVEEALGRLESDAYPVMRKGALVPPADNDSNGADE